MYKAKNIKTGEIVALKKVSPKLSHAPLHFCFCNPPFFFLLDSTGIRRWRNPQHGAPNLGNVFAVCLLMFLWKLCFTCLGRTGSVYPQTALPPEYCTASWRDSHWNELDSGFWVLRSGPQELPRRLWRQRRRGLPSEIVSVPVAAEYCILPPAPRVTQVCVLNCVLLRFILLHNHPSAPNSNIHPEHQH